MSASNAAAIFTEAGIPLLSAVLVGPIAAGLYRIAYSLMSLPRAVAHIFGRVLYSVMAAQESTDARRTLAWRIFLGLALASVPAMLTVGGFAPVWVRFVFRSTEWEALPFIVFLAGIHWSLYTLHIVPAHALILAGEAGAVLRSLALYALSFSVLAVVSADQLSSASVPVAGVAASATLVLLLRQFGRVYSPHRLGLVYRQLAILLPASCAAWWLCSSGHVAGAIGLWASVLGVWLMLDQEGKHVTGLLIRNLPFRRRR